MRITLLGHATVVVEMDGATCLMDPVFFDPFEEGAVISCPQRRVYPERLPDIDILVISHRHPDHFDLQSLNQVSRDADVIVPADALIIYALRKLGFERIHPVHPMAPILSEGFELYPTASLLPSPHEFGLVLKDASGVFWNQVDSLLDDRTIDTVATRFGGVDLLFAAYASQNFEYFDNRSIGFPHDVHGANLAHVLRIAPRCVVPGAAGFQFCGDHAWLNRFLFPISRELFVADLQRLGFPGGAQIMNPGDVMEIDRGAATYHAAASEIAAMVEDDSANLRFDPTAAVPALADPNPEGRSRVELSRIIDPFLRGGMVAYARAAYDDGDRLAQLYRRCGTCYGLEIVFPEGPPDWYRFAFDDDAVRVSSGTGVAAPSDAVNRIAASALAGWITNDKSFFYVRAYSRRFQMSHTVTRAGRDVRVEGQTLPDLLMHYLLNLAAGSELAAKHHVDRQIEAISRGASSTISRS
jgi:UDP-MurNAc hydroxylase